MTIKLLSLQIPIFWQSIKYAATKADGVRHSSLQEYLNELLLALLNDKAQCFVRLDEEKKLQAIMITRVKVDKITDRKYLFIQCLFSFVKVNDNVWGEDFKFLQQFAIKEKCNTIIFESNNEHIKELAKKHDFNYSFTTMFYNMGGK